MLKLAFDLSQSQLTFLVLHVPLILHLCFLLFEQALHLLHLFLQLRVIVFTLLQLHLQLAHLGLVLSFPLELEQFLL